MKVIKRDGRRQNFNKDRIKEAVLASFRDVDGEENTFAKLKAAEIANYIEDYASDQKSISVEKIQDMVEDKLMASSRKDVARNYILYRNKRTKVREYNTEFMKAVTEKIEASNVQNQNANVDEYSFGGRMGEANSALMKKFALDNCVSEMAKQNHLNNEVYIHDLDHYPVGDHNCLSIPFDRLLEEGFDTRQTDVRRARSVNTAFQLVAVIFQLQSLQQFGGVAATHLDWTMVPYVRVSLFKHYLVEYLKQMDDFYTLDILNMNEDELDAWAGQHQNEYLEKFALKEDDFFIGSEKLDQKLYQAALFETRRETHQAVEAMYHNLNTLQSRSGNQLPFTSINYGTCTLPEGRMVTKALLDVSIKGIGRFHKTPIFPCGIFQCMKGINRKPGEPNYDLYRMALKSTATRLYPNYANVDWSANAGYDRNDPSTYVATMGCRTYNGFDINGFGQRKDGRGNICPVTIILPTLAMEAKSKTGDPVENFMGLLDVKLHEAKDMLIERFEYICSQSPASAKFMYGNNVMDGYVSEEGIRSALKHGTLALGQIGLAETLQILIDCDHTEDRGMVLAKRIEELFQKRCKEFKEAHKLNIGVYYTPAENLCYTAMQRFKKKYGEIPNVSDKEFFTNSIHVPVWIHMDPFKKIDIESQLTGYSNAGCITYVELESSVKNNLDALETIVNYAMDKDVPYFAVNVPNDMCMNCGYTDDMNDVCPICGSDCIQRLRRVTGYLTGNYTTAFNLGKQQEVEMRYKHSNDIPNWKR